MFTVSIETKFQASHRLAMSGGWKEPLHKHNFSVTAKVNSTKLNSMGLVIDFQRFIDLLEEITSKLDNTNLNENKYFKENCSTEMVAKYLYEKLELKLPRNVKLQSVAVIEATGCAAKFSK